MAKEIKTEIRINTTPEKVWQVLTDFENFPKWNPFIQSITGDIALGEKLIVKILPPNRKLMTFNPRVVVSIPNEELQWLGSGPIIGLFDGQHSFKIIQESDGSVKFEHGERFTGILVGLMPKLLKDTELGFNQMNEALKTRCEL